MTQRKAPSGAVRDARDGKGRYDLINPFATRALARAMEEGAEHYGERNWELGQPLSWYLDSGPRHIDEYKITRDPKHLRAAMWNMHAAMALREMIDLGILPPELDDLPHYMSGHEPDAKPDFGSAKGITWQSDAGPAQSPTTSPSGAHESTPQAHAAKPAYSNTPQPPTS